MRIQWVSVFGTLFLSWGFSAAAQAQLPGPIPPPPEVPPPAVQVPPPGEVQAVPTDPAPAAVGDVPVHPQASVAPPLAAAPAAGTSSSSASGGTCASFCDSLTSWLHCGGSSDPSQQLGISAGGGAYFIVPYFSANPAYFSKTGTNTSQQNFGNQGGWGGTGYVNFALTPEWSVKARFWQIDVNSSTSGGVGGATVFDAGGNTTGTPSAAGSSASADSNLSINFYNIDLARRWTPRPGVWFELSGGIAFVHMSQSYALNVYDPLAGASFYNANHNYNGLGSTVAFEGHFKRPDSDFGLYGSARATVFIGSSDQSYYGANPIAAAAGSSSSVNMLSVGEMELGGEWTHTCGRFGLSLQLGVVGQIWLGGGDAAQGSNLSGANLGGQAGYPANFGFIGGVARAGITF